MSQDEGFLWVRRTPEQLADLANAVRVELGDGWSVEAKSQTILELTAPDNRREFLRAQMDAATMRFFIGLAKRAYAERRA